jgi:adenylate cyclase class 2
MKRIVFENPHDSENSFFRLRDEGNKITCTYKNILPGDKNIDSVSEVETAVTDFEAMKKILLLTGLKIKAYQETYRETWSI